MSSGNQTPDRFPGPLQEDDEILLGEQSVDPTVVGAIRLVSGEFRLKDSIGVFNPRSGGTGFDPDTILVNLAGDVVVNTSGNVLISTS